MDNIEAKNFSNSSDNLSLTDLFAKIKLLIAYIKSKWLTAVALALVGGLLGLAVAILKKPLYSSVCTFVLEDGGKAGGLGQYASIASLAGIDINGGGGGVFQADNILELYRSRLMIKKTLLSTQVFNGKRQLLIERYITFGQLRKEWKKRDNIESINFEGNPEKFNRTQDSLITDITETFNKKHLSVSKPDKKLTILRVEFVSKDELFAMAFVSKLVENVNDFYTLTKTKKTYQNVVVLQRQADSVRRILNSSISGVASAIDAAPNANPAMLILRVPSQKKQIDVQANTAIYTEIVKNLEVAKVSFMQAKPLIQIIDSPVLPLKVSKIGKVKGAAIGLILGLVIAVVVLLIKGLFKQSVI